MVSDSFLVIACCAILTYSLRLGGLVLVGRLPKTGKFKRFMDALPGTILLSLIVPAAINGGPLSWGATVVTALVSLRSGNLFQAMVVGVTIVAVGRMFGLQA